MQRYFFNIRAGERLTLDEEGAWYGSVQLAREEAEASAREMMAERLKAGKPVDGQIFEVVTEAGDLAFTVRFRDMIQL